MLVRTGEGSSDTVVGMYVSKPPTETVWFLRKPETELLCDPAPYYWGHSQRKWNQSVTESWGCSSDLEDLDLACLRSWDFISSTTTTKKNFFCFTRHRMLKGYLNTHVYCSTIHYRKGREWTDQLIDKSIKKKYMYTIEYYSATNKEWNPTNCGKMDETGRH
jgi:hypothetical protein